MQVQPIAKMHVETLPGGIVWNPELAFSPDGTVLYIRQPTPLITTWDRVRWRAPEAGAVLLIVGLAWAVWTIRRAHSRPRRVGLPYCRRCNYELSAPAIEPEGRRRWRWTSEQARCTECGRRERPIVGRGRLWRLVLPLFAAITMLAGGSGVLRWSLTRHAQGVTWPVRGIERVAPAVAFDRMMPRGPRGHRVTRWEVPTGRPLGTLLTERVWGMRNGMLSPDGELFAVVCMSREGRMSLVAVDTASGERREVNAGAEWTWGDLAGFTPDSREVLVQWGKSGGMSFTTRLERISMDSLQRDVVTTKTVANTPLTQGSEVPFSRFVTDGKRWVFVVLRRTPVPGSAVADIVCSDERGERRWTSPVSAAAWYEPRLAGDTLVVPLFGTSTELQVDLGTQATSIVPAPPAVVGQMDDGRKDVRASPTGGNVFENGVQTHSLDIGRPGALSSAAFSRDGRFVAASMNAIKAGAKPGSADPSDYETAVYLWDLAPGRYAPGK